MSSLELNFVSKHINLRDSTTCALLDPATTTITNPVGHFTITISGTGFNITANALATNENINVTPAGYGLYIIHATATLPLGVAVATLD